jgi:hypothetical protein
MAFDDSDKWPTDLCGVEIRQGSERVGCYCPARCGNPNYGKTGKYNYVKVLCAEHYDDVIQDNERAGIKNGS